MLGMVFTEFLDMVEERFSPATADRILTEAALPHGGAYTAVGYYPHEEMVTLVTLLSRHTQVPADDLVRAFGHHLLGRFACEYPAMFADAGCLFDFLATIDRQIHVQVRKLYPKAMLPRFTVLARSEDALHLRYESPRSMEALARGLIEGAIEHYGEPHAVALRRSPAADAAHPPASIFVVTRSATA